MNGTGVPLATPFDDSGAVDEPKLRAVASWVVDRGVDFVVPAGSNSESELMTLDERARVVATVADEVSVPVLAGTGHPGLVETLEGTRRAAEAGADAALVVTPFYFEHSQADLAAYYREVADGSPLPVYLYDVPKMTGTRLEPETVAGLADHDNVVGIKDSGGDLVTFQRTRRMTGPDFETFVGSGGLYAPALDAGADGGIMALANAVPDLASEVYDRHREGDVAGARELCADLVELNRAITAEYGVPGVKAAMRHRDAPAGQPRSPHRPLDEDATREVRALVDEALETWG
jgi:4-hydroxy-tetrahydrodipicolinate synthase